MKQSSPTPPSSSANSVSREEREAFYARIYEILGCQAPQVKDGTATLDREQRDSIIAAFHEATPKGKIAMALLVGESVLLQIFMRRAALSLRAMEIHRRHQDGSQTPGAVTGKSRETQEQEAFERHFGIKKDKPEIFH